MMGYHHTTLPASYDAWRLAGPPEPRRRSAPATVTEPLLIETRDMTLDAFGTYDAETGALISVKVNGTHKPPHEIEAFFGSALGRELADLDQERLDEILEQLAEDAECDRADHINDLRREEQ